MNYKRCDYYQVENEEMSCSNMCVNNNSLDKFFNERNVLDKRSKDMMFNMLIPPPVSEDKDANI